MKLQRRFAPTGGEFAPESVARFIGICSSYIRTSPFVTKLSQNLTKIA
jgi:hypothetical protein